jgi:hypothetical protein
MPTSALFEVNFRATGLSLPQQAKTTPPIHKESIFTCILTTFILKEKTSYVRTLPNYQVLV